MNELKYLEQQATLKIRTYPPEKRAFITKRYGGKVV